MAMTTKSGIFEKKKPKKKTIRIDSVKEVEVVVSDAKEFFMDREVMKDVNGKKYIPWSKVNSEGKGFLGKRYLGE